MRETHRCRPRFRSVPTPSRCRKSSARPIPRNRRADGAQAPMRAHAPRLCVLRVIAASASAFSAAPTSAPSVRIIARMPATSRWLKACTATPCADQVGHDVGLQIGEGQHQIGLEREDFRDVGADEGGDARLLLAHLRRAHRIAGDADDAILLAEEIERLDGFLGQADDAARAGTCRDVMPRRPAASWKIRRHRASRPPVPSSSRTTVFAICATSSALWLT